MKKLDELDYKILDTLKDKGSVVPSVSVVSRKLVKPVATIHARLKRLEKRGVVVKYAPLIDSKKVEDYIESFVLIQLSPGAKIDRFATDIALLDYVTELHLVVGEWTFIAKLRARNMGEYAKNIGDLSNRIRPLKMVDIISPQTFKKEL